MSKELSVVIPVFKVEKYIAETINSLLAQTYKDFEVILVDDGSQDNSISIAKQILDKENIDYKIVVQENTGLGGARATGQKNATGKYVYFLDSDDLILPNTLSVMISTIKEEKSDLVFCDFYNFFDGAKCCDDNDGGIENFTKEQMQVKFLDREVIALAPGTVYDLEFLERNDLRFEKLRWSEDQHFMWRVLSKITKATHVKRPFYQYRQRKGSIMTSTSTDKIIDAYQYILDLPSYFEAGSLVNRFVVSRWVLGTLNATSVITTYKEWKRLFNAIEGKKHLKTLVKFKNKKVKITAVIGLISKRLYYKILNLKKKKVK